MLSNDLAAVYTRVYAIHPSLRLVPTTVGNRDSVEMPYSQRLPPVNWSNSRSLQQDPSKNQWPSAVPLAGSNSPLLGTPNLICPTRTHSRHHK